MVMTFTSFEFFVFIVTFLIIYWAFKQCPRSQNAFLLIGCIAFYILNIVEFDKINERIIDYLLLACVVAISVLINFKGGIWLEAHKDDPGSRRIFIGLVIFNVAVLCYYKYLIFYLKIFGNNIASSFIVPIGISFFTFSMIAYLAEIYKGNTTSEHGLLNFSIFCLFFPKILAGPIERGPLFLE
ncbi:hypothetical protein GF325_10795 [Candidatus Bathyarchaeota archaeon]|nr:hypothetical protein [Candidatus Bathyarchaeota archaeon]